MSVRGAPNCLIVFVWLAALTLVCLGDPVLAAKPTETVSQRPLAKRLADSGVHESIFAVRQPGKDPHWYANFGYYADSETRLTYGNGGKLCRLDLATRSVTTILEDRDGAIRDPVVHYDAQRILFSYRKGRSPCYHLYEINLDGSKLRQLTDGPYDDIEPCYLPDGQIVFISSRCNRWVNCWATKVANMHHCDADGQEIYQISANIEHDSTPWPLPDGRVLYLRWEHVDRSQAAYHHLWTANPDGTAETVYFGNQNPGTVMIDAKPIPNTGKVVAIFSPGDGQREHDGTITIVDVRKGPDQQDSARPITREPRYRDPWAFSEDLFMAASRDRIVLLDAAGHEEEIYRLSAAETAAGMQCHEPRPIIRRPREHVIPDRCDPQSEAGWLFLKDVYHGRNMTGVKRGEIKKLLVLEILPKPINFSGNAEPLTYGGSYTLERVLGTVPVEPDGSAFFELPAMRPVFFVALDENDMAVKRMQSFTTVQPGETGGCVGCHERRTETVLPHANALALARGPSEIDWNTDSPDVFDFPRDVQPILDRLCAECHGYRKTPRGGPFAGNVVLTGDRGPVFSHAYYTMTVRRLFSDNRNQPKSNLPPRAVGSSASRIFTILDGSHYGVRADDDETKVLRLWIETGAPYPGTYAALGCGSIGSFLADRPVDTDADWPTTRAGAEVIARRCASCHQGDRALPQSLSDERDVSSWQIGMNDPRLRMSRHIVFNLTHPQQSLLLLAPLAESAGGFALCRDEHGKTARVFANTTDADYRMLLAMVAAGKQRLEATRRFDMPDFRPCAAYMREMAHYDILPLDQRKDAPVDPYDMDRRYWESLWYRAPVSPFRPPRRMMGGRGPWRPMGPRPWFPGQPFPGPWFPGPMNPRPMDPGPRNPTHRSNQ
jgi:hypothetical protein